MFVEVLYGACQVVSEPSLVFLICHLRADEQMPKVSENFIKEYLYVKKMLSLIKKITTVATFAKPSLSTISWVLL